MRPSAMSSKPQLSANGAAANEGINETRPITAKSPAAFVLDTKPMVSLPEALKDMCAELVSSLGYDGRLEFLRNAAENCVVRSDIAAMVVLIVKEAVTNAIKFAHPAGVLGTITIACRQHRSGTIAIEVADDGVGLPENFDPALSGNTGFRIMRALSERLRATLVFRSTSLGLHIRLQVPPTPFDARALGPACTDRIESDLAKSNNELKAGVVDREEQARRQELLDALPVAIYTTDVDGRITFYNEAAAALWGMRPQLSSSEFCGSWRLYWPDGTPLPHDKCPMAMSLKEKRPIRDLEAVAERPDGTRVRFLPYPTPLFDASGALTGAVNMLLDITELRRAEQAAYLLASIIESSNDAIVSKDLNGIVTSWNRGAELLFGYAVNEMIGRPILTVIPPDRYDEEVKIIEHIRRGERVDHYESVRRRKDGKLIDISLTVSPIKDAAGKVVGASKIARDITERKQAQARQELLTREIQHRTKNLFAVVLSVVARSFANRHTVKDAESAVLSRLRSLAQTHAMLIDKEWQGADLAEVVRTEMSAFADRVDIEGPSLMLTAKAAQNFALALHELATNAAKYGALSNATGRVNIGWTIVKSKESNRFTFRWQEQGGPPVSPSTQRGFGSVVLEHVMAEYFDVPPRIDFAVGGVSYEVNGSVDSVT